MQRLVVVSCRVPVLGDRNPAAVGLADAVIPGTLWFGWSGRREQVPLNGELPG